MLDYGEYEGRLFIVTDSIDGAALDAHCGDLNLDRRDRVRLLASVADAVQSVHEKGVLHRDIKPANVIIDAHGQVALVDLGIATLIGRDLAETITAEGTPIGSPAYMAPEQARGEREAISTRSDVYGLGATAYEVLAGGCPFDTDTTVHEAIRRVAHDEPRDPREIDGTLPKPLAAVLRKAVAPVPADRYSGAAEFAADLRRWLAGDPVEAGSLSLGQRAGRLLARHPIAATGALCALIFGLTVAATSLTVWYVNVKPYDVVIDPVERSWVRLLARNGRILFTWDTGETRGIASAMLADRDSKLGGGRIVLIGFRQYLDRPELDGRLCAFALHDLDTPLWTSDIEPPDIAVPGGGANQRFGITMFSVVDLFEESPGDEIVAIHPHDLEGTAVIRIYDMAGLVLFEAWHHGALSSIAPIPGTDLIVACGVNSEATWAERDQPATAYNRYPYVVFALRPSSNRDQKGWIRLGDRPGRIAAAWYRCIVPPAASDLLSIGEPQGGFRRPQVRLATKKAVQLLLAGRTPPHGSVSLYIDEHGSLIEKVVSDDFKFLGDPPPEVTDFGMTNLPPIVPAGDMLE
jgi:hypothetical protein